MYMPQYCPYMRMINEYNTQIKSTLEKLSLEAYIYGYPLVLEQHTEKNDLASGSHINQFFHQKTLSTPSYTKIVRPNADTLYSNGWLDLSKEPIILHVPDMHNTYYIIQMLDAWTNTFTSIGSRTTGNREGFFAIAGPYWKCDLPKEITIINSPTNRVWLLGRTQTNGPKDYAKVYSIQKNYTLTPLSYFKKYKSALKSYNSVEQLNIEQTPTMYQVAQMNGAEFFQTMSAAMNMNPSPINDDEITKKLAVLGIVLGEKFDFYKLPPLVQYSLENAAKNGPKLIHLEGRKSFKNNTINGWTLFIKNIGTYGVNYLQRAIIALFGIGANLPQDAVYGVTFNDITDSPLIGNKNYIVHFSKGQLPPVNGFWSITLYNSEGFLVENPINRYAISPHLGKLNYNKDGCLDIFIQNNPPGKDKQRNWLPAPKGLFNLALRMYWPKEAVLNGKWQPPPVLQINK